MRPSWEGNHASGQGSLVAFRSLPDTFAIWKILCVFHPNEINAPKDGTLAPVQVFQVGLHSLHQDLSEVPGFTVSYRSSGIPSILRVVPDWTEEHVIASNPDFWRTSSMNTPQSSSLPQDTQSASSLEIETERQSSESLAHPGSSKQKSLKAHFKSFQTFVGTALGKARDRFSSYCSKFHKGEKTPEALSFDESTHDTGSPSSESTSQALVEGQPTITDPTLSSAHALPSRSAAPFPPTGSNDITILPPASYFSLKIFGLILILFSLFTWVILRLRDPRLQADRAARREERRNKRLYRQAARHQKFKRWFCSWRHRGHQCTPVGTWEEKRLRVIQQEEVLEEVMKADIRKLRRTRRVENSLGAAEEGRNVFVYDSDHSRRRSRETLPGYESEGTQPPSYDDQGVGSDEPSVANGFQFTPPESEDTPDSSVISTSPRTSRDERDSDFGRDFEPLTLCARVAA